MSRFKIACVYIRFYIAPYICPVRFGRLLIPPYGILPFDLSLLLRRLESKPFVGFENDKKIAIFWARFKKPKLKIIEIFLKR